MHGVCVLRTAGVLCGQCDSETAEDAHDEETQEQDKNQEHAPY